MLSRTLIESRIMMRTRILLTLPVAAALLFSAETIKTPINNDAVRVLDVVVQPHEKTSMHEHKANRVMIYKIAGAQRFQYEDGRTSTLTFHENDVKWSPIEGKHIAEVATGHPVGIVEIELKKQGAGKTVTTNIDPLKADPKHYKLEFENDQVRVFHVKIGPHESTPLHEHQLKRIMVYLTDASVRVTNADGSVDMTPHKAGDILQGGAAKHSEQNTTDKPVEVIVTELKY
jgi:quercetin dioxygenase-like cupin family protein